ncbi:general secretion pathway protein GspA [Thalassotalea sp. 42_200_T64]|nr:general secretion pathway protein GspA [Thalassotalea sp. 42_200_T64]
MYEQYYGLSEKPFQLSPDPKFFFGSKEHKQALSYLQYGLEQGEGFIVITGPIGTGKTMIAQSLIKTIDHSAIEAIQIVTSNLSPIELLIIIAKKFQLPTSSDNKAILLEHIYQHLLTLNQQGKYALILVDEAQNLPIETIEELRMLSNFQKNNKPLLQSFLLGQAELKARLQSPQMEQFRQRIIASYHLEPLTNEELKLYIKHRLKLAGLVDQQLLSEDCFTLIAQKTLGIPRKINLLMDRTLLYGFLNDLSCISSGNLQTVLNEMENELSAAISDTNADAMKVNKPILDNKKSTTILSELEQYLEENIDQKVKLNRYLDKLIKQKEISRDCK